MQKGKYLAGLLQKVRELKECQTMLMRLFKVTMAIEPQKYSGCFWHIFFDLFYKLCYCEFIFKIIYKFFML